MATIKLGLVCLAAILVEGSSRFLAPVQDINLPASESAEHPLEHLGANGPWFAGTSLYLTLISIVQHRLPLVACQDLTSMRSHPKSRRIVMLTKQRIFLGMDRDTQILALTMDGSRCRNESVTYLSVI